MFLTKEVVQPCPYRLYYRAATAVTTVRREDLAPVGDGVDELSLEGGTIETGYVCVLDFTVACGDGCAELGEVRGENVSLHLFWEGI